MLIIVNDLHEQRFQFISFFVDNQYCRYMKLKEMMYSFMSLNECYVEEKRTLRLSLRKVMIFSYI